MSFLVGSLISGGLGLLGGAINSQRKFGGYGAINDLLDEFDDPSRNLQYFQRIAQDAAPSQSDLLSVAAATGGSATAANQQARQAQVGAGDQALQSFNRYKQGLDQLRANLVTGKTQMQMQDFQTRRNSMTSMFNNIAQMGFGYGANQLGQRQQMKWMDENGYMDKLYGGFNTKGSGTFGWQPGGNIGTPTWGD